MSNLEGAGKSILQKAPAQTKKALASTAKYPAFAKRGNRVQAFFV
jgi:hypothetical protein